MDQHLRRLARAVIGFMPEEEGLALYEAALAAATHGPVLEVGSYCGKSAIYLGAAARERDQVVYSIDHHRGSEEHQPGEEYHDERLVDPLSGKVDTLPAFVATITDARLRDTVVGICARSAELAAVWSRPVAMVFIDGSHSPAAADADLTGWAPHVKRGGLLAIHDVFPDPNDGGRAPYEIYERALASGFVEQSATGSLRVLMRA